MLSSLDKLLVDTNLKKLVKLTPSSLETSDTELNNGLLKNSSRDVDQSLLLELVWMRKVTQEVSLTLNSTEALLPTRQWSSLVKKLMEEPLESISLNQEEEVVVAVEAAEEEAVEVASVEEAEIEAVASVEEVAAASAAAEEEATVVVAVSAEEAETEVVEEEAEEEELQDSKELEPCSEELLTSPTCHEVCNFFTNS